MAFSLLNFFLLFCVIYTNTISGCLLVSCCRRQKKWINYGHTKALFWIYFTIHCGPYTETNWNNIKRVEKRKKKEPNWLFTVMVIVNSMLCVCSGIGRSESVPTSSFFGSKSSTRSKKKVHVSQFVGRHTILFRPIGLYTWLLGFIYVVFPIWYSVCGCMWVSVML